MSVLRGAYWAVRLGRHRPDLSVPDGYEIFGEPAADAGEMAAVMRVPEADITERFAHGDRAWTAWWQAPSGIGDELVAWCWVATGEHLDEPVQRLLRLAPDECYGYGADAVPAHRGNGFFASLLQHAGAAMLREGRTIMWGGIADENEASRRSCRRAGFQPVLSVTLADGVLECAPVPYAEEELVARAGRMLDMDVPSPPLD